MGPHKLSFAYKTRTRNSALNYSTCSMGLLRSCHHRETIQPKLLDLIAHLVSVYGMFVLLLTTWRNTGQM